MAKQIISTRNETMRNEEHSGFMQQTMENLPLLPEEKAKSQQEALIAAAKEENDLLEAAKSNVTTKALTETDQVRDACWNGARMFVDAMLAYPGAEEQAAAQRIKDIMDKYGDPRTMPYLQENGALENLIQDLETEKATADLKLIYASHWLTKLKEYNTEFIRLFNERNNAESAKENGAIKKARTKTDKAYRELVQVVNALVRIDGESEYVAFIDAMNKLVEYERTVLARRKTIAAAKRAGEDTDAQ